MTFSPHNFKILPSLQMDFFGLVKSHLSLFFFGDYVSIITIVSNITLLVSYNVVLAGYFKPMIWAIKSIRRLLKVSFPPLSPIPSFHQVCLFYKQYFIVCMASIKSSYRKCSVKKSVLKNFAILTGKRVCWNLFLKACNFIKKRLQ